MKTVEIFAWLVTFMVFTFWIGTLVHWIMIAWFKEIAKLRKLDAMHGLMHLNAQRAGSYPQEIRDDEEENLT